MSIKISKNENKIMLFLALIFILLMFVYLNFDTTTGEARKLSNISKYNLRQGELSAYFGEVTKAKPIGYVINGNR